MDAMKTRGYRMLWKWPEALQLHKDPQRRWNFIEDLNKG